MSSRPTAAELELQKKYALLRKKKQQAGQQEQAPAVAAPAPIAKEDAARQAAIRALQARRAAQQGGAAPPPAEAAAQPTSPTVTVSRPAGPLPPGAKPILRLKVKLPLKKPEEGAAAAQPAVPATVQLPAAAQAPAAQLPAAQQPGPAGRPPPVEAATAAPPAAKRPSIKRPTIKRPPLPPAAPAAAAQPLGSPPRPEDLYAPAGYQAAGDGAGPETGGDVDRDLYSKRQRIDEEAAAEASGEQRAQHARLYVGSLPENITQEALQDFFCQFGNVAEAHLVGTHGYGFVQFATHEEALAVVEFAAVQPIYLDDCDWPIAVHWARQSRPGGGGGGEPGGGDAADGGGDAATLAPQGVVMEHPRVIEARMEAAAVAETIDQEDLAEVNLDGPPPERELVSYYDL